MKILHVTTELASGAGLGAVRLHRDLLAAGVDSMVMSLSMASDDPRIVPLFRTGQSRKRRLRDIPSAVLHRIGAYDALYYRAKRAIGLCRNISRAFVSTPFTRIDISRHPLVLSADIVHLHWVANFLDWPSFFPSIRKPVVWTMRDENPALGFWHFRSDMPDHMPDRIRHEDDWLRRAKAGIVGKCRSLSVVSLSSGEDEFFTRSSAFIRRPHAVIPNSIDDSVFKPGGGDALRVEFGVSPQDIVLAFIAQYLDESRKGLADLLEAVSKLHRKDVVVLCVGRGDPPPIPDGVRFILVGPVKDNARLSSVYSAANLFISPSYAETFGKTMTEALACGIPVVSYPNSGARDIVGPEDGILSVDFSPESLATAIRDALTRAFDRMSIRERVVARFSSRTIAQSYIQLYRKSMI